MSSLKDYSTPNLMNGLAFGPYSTNGIANGNSSRYKEDHGSSNGFAHCQNGERHEENYISENFLDNGLLALRFLKDYHNDVQNLPVRPPSETIKPGYMRNLISERANEEPIEFHEIMTQVTDIILPGIVHWQSPKFHGYFPTGFSEASVFADIISATFSCVGFNWTACPAYTELEMIMVDWMAREMNLPDKFRFDANQGGGGVIQGTASEAVVVAFVVAREKKIAEVLATSPDGVSYYDVLGRLRAYTSDQAHSSVVKGAKIAAVKLIVLDSEPDLKLGASTLREQIQGDVEQGLIPFFVCGTLGTTNTCAFDDFEAIGQIGQKFGVWFHVDAAYAGAILLCEEYHNMFPGLKYAQSFSFNPHKMMSVCFDCSILWVDDGESMKKALGINPLYLKTDADTIEYRDWQIPLGRRFRSLKLYFHIQMYGTKKIKTKIRQIIELAEYMSSLLKANPNFSIPYPVFAGMVCFNVKDSEEKTQTLFKRLNEKDIYLSCTQVKGQLLIRFPVGCWKCERKDIEKSYALIEQTYDEVANNN